MTTIRKDVFETNSSSMHAITVCAYSKDNEYVRKELKRWEMADGSYNINIVLDAKNVDKCDFTVRSYVKHDSINDKLMYLFATIIQHYNAKLNAYHYSDTTSEKYKNWNIQIIRDTNKQVHEQFIDEINGLEHSLKYHFENITGQNVNVKFNYIINKDTDMIEYLTDDDKDGCDWFSTGCYGNEEFYYAVENKMAYWIMCPFNQILAGGDEMDNEDYVKQRKKAKKLLKQSWKAYKKYHSTEWGDDEVDPDLIFNFGKVIFPIGG